MNSYPVGLYLSSAKISLGRILLRFLIYKIGIRVSVSWSLGELNELKINVCRAWNRAWHTIRVIVTVILAIIRKNWKYQIVPKY